MKKKIAIIGAGMAGLTLATRLGPHADVSLFEKARGVGGRMSTRHAGPFDFDHGAQYFTVRDQRFRQFLEPHFAAGLIQEWKGKVITLDPEKKLADRLWFEPHYVACPGMNSLCQNMADGIEIELNCEVAALTEKNAHGWTLFNTAGRRLGNYDLVISTAPPVQTCRLFDPFLPPASRLRHSKMLACYTLMIGWNAKWTKPWIAAKINNSPLDWISVNSSKPDRNHAVTTMVVHANNSWAEQHVDDDQAATETFLRQQLSAVLELGHELAAPDYFSMHRWRYARLETSGDDENHYTPFYDNSMQLASVGDWSSQSRIEDVWLEAGELAEQILE